MSEIKFPVHLVNDLKKGLWWSLLSDKILGTTILPMPINKLIPTILPKQFSLFVQEILK